MSRKIRILLSVALSVLIAVALASAAADALSVPSTTVPSVTLPAVTTPAVTTPARSPPRQSKPQRSPPQQSPTPAVTTPVGLRSGCRPCRCLPCPPRRVRRPSRASATDRRSHPPPRFRCRLRRAPLEPGISGSPSGGRDCGHPRRRGPGASSSAASATAAQSRARAVRRQPGRRRPSCRRGQPPPARARHPAAGMPARPVPRPGPAARAPGRTARPARAQRGRHRPRARSNAVGRGPPRTPRADRPAWRGIERMWRVPGRARARLSPRCSPPASPISCHRNRRAHRRRVGAGTAGGAAQAGRSGTSRTRSDPRAGSGTPTDRTRHAADDRACEQPGRHPELGTDHRPGRTGAGGSLRPAARVSCTGASASGSRPRDARVTRSAPAAPRAAPAARPAASAGAARWPAGAARTPAPATTTAPAAPAPARVGTRSPGGVDTRRAAALGPARGRSRRRDADGDRRRSRPAAQSCAPALGPTALIRSGSTPGSRAPTRRPDRAKRS